MRKKKKKILTPLWENAQVLLKENKLEEADDVLMTLVWRIALYTMKGYNDDYKIEGVKKAVWYEREWVAIEAAGLLPE